jgi:hypothetical protein
MSSVTKSFENTNLQHMSNQANQTTVSHEGGNTFRVSLSELDLNTLCFLSHLVKFQEHYDAGRALSEYQHETADASAVISRTLEVLLEGVRRSGSWENGLLDLVFPDFDDFRIEAYNEYLWEKEERLQQRWEELDELATKAEDAGQKEELDKIVSEFERVEKEIDEMMLAIKVAEKLARNPGLD